MNTPPKINHTRYFGVLGICLIALSSGCSFFGPSKEQVEAKARQETAMRMWKERCQTKAGIKIYRTAENVEGIFLMKLRVDDITFADQFKMNDPYGRDFDEKRYVQSFLRDSAYRNKGFEDIQGFLYVEAIDPADGKRYRYTGRIEEPGLYNEHYSRGYKRFVMDRVLAPDKLPRYGVTYDDISTHEEREYWIAGSSLKVIDLQTHEVMAERIGYMVDYFQGSQAGGRSPWLFAADYACPSFYPTGTHGSYHQRRQTIRFVEKSVTPIKEQ
jgi:hypothetical protein